MANQNKNRANDAHQNKQRPARIPMSAGNKLHVADHLKKEGYQQYWQVDRPGVIEQMLSFPRLIAQNLLQPRLLSLAVAAWDRVKISH